MPGNTLWYHSSSTLHSISDLVSVRLGLSGGNVGGLGLFPYDDVLRCRDGRETLEAIALVLAQPLEHSSRQGRRPRQQLRQLYRRHRSSEQPALAVVHALFAQEVCLGAVLDAFGHDLESQ